MRHLLIGDVRLNPLSLSDKAVFDAALSELSIPLSDYTFANNYIWLAMISGFHAEIEGCLCLFSLSGNVLSLLLPPIGVRERQLDALEASFDLMEGYNQNPYLGKVEYVHKDFLELLGVGEDVPLPLVGGTQWLVEPANPDYIYRTEDLIHLSGNRYKDKRNLINQFRRAFPEHRTEIFTSGHRDSALMLANTWLSQRLKYIAPADVDRALYFMELERTAIQRSLMHAEDLGLQGLCLFNGDELLGFTLGERISSQVASILIEKTNLDILGCAQYLFREFAKSFPDCEFINVGDDLGMENLRRVKMSYRPAMFGIKYTIKRYAGENDC